MSQWSRQSVALACLLVYQVSFSKWRFILFSSQTDTTATAFHFYCIQLQSHSSGTACVVKLEAKNGMWSHWLDLPAAALTQMSVISWTYFGDGKVLREETKMYLYVWLNVLTNGVRQSCYNFLRDKQFLEVNDSMSHIGNIMFFIVCKTLTPTTKFDNDLIMCSFMDFTIQSCYFFSVNSKTDTIFFSDIQRGINQMPSFFYYLYTVLRLLHKFCNINNT